MRIAKMRYKRASYGFNIHEKINMRNKYTQEKDYPTYKHSLNKYPYVFDSVYEEDIIAERNK